MSKRNFILLIIVLVVAALGFFGFLYLKQPTPPTTGTTSGTNFFSQFNPFGNSSSNKPPATTPPPVDVSGYVPPETTPTAPTKLTKVSSVPVAGFTIFSKERLKEIPIETTPSTTANPPTAKTKTVKPQTEFVPALRYVDRATGYIYQTFADTLSEQKFSETIIPTIYDAYFGNNGQSVLMRYLKPDGETIETFLGTLPKEPPVTAENTDTTVGQAEIKGSFLPDDIKDISLSPDASKAFYLFENNGNIDDMVGTTLNFSDNKKVQLFESPFSEWLSGWPTTSLITMTTKPSGSVPGYMYTIDPAKKNLIQVFGGINGLTTLTSPSGKLVLYGNSALTLSIYHTDTKTSDVLGIKTLPEKCVWNKTGDTIYCAVPKSINSGLYPDAWYQGEVSFNDQIWKIDVKTGTAALLLDPLSVANGEDVDGIKLAVDQNENYLFFVNKKDSFLWKFDLK